MADTKNPKTPTTDDMIAALAEEFGLGDGPAAPSAPAPASAPAPPKQQPPVKRAAPAAPKPPPRPELDDIADIFGPGGDGDSEPLGALEADGDDLDFDEGEMLAARSRKRTAIAFLITIVVVLAACAAVMYVFLANRHTELAAAEIEPDTWLEMITDFDIHTEEIREYKQRKAHEAQLAKTPIYGNLRLETEPTFANVTIDCIPMDTHCNNAGTKEAPRWESQYVRDEEIGDRKCSTDRDCQDCKPAPAPTPGEPPIDPRKLCRFPDAKCAGSVCRLPMKTAITIQSLFVGTLAELQPDRKYRVRIFKPGWQTETIELGASAWDTKLVPQRDDSDRVAIRRLDLKPDPNAPEELRKEVEEYLRKKAEAEAAMMQEMEKWEQQ